MLPATTGALKVVGGISTQENLNDSVNVTDNTPSTSTATGALKVTGGVGIVENLFVGGTGKIENPSTSTATGALKVTGGVGIVENLFVGGTGKIENITDATTTTTGALKVAGGISTQTNVHASNVYTQGGLITNRAGTCKKTYSHNGTLPTNATIANGTFTVSFLKSRIPGKDIRNFS